MCDTAPRPAHRSEIMTSGWCDGRLGGLVVVLDQVQSTAAWVGSPIKPLSTHGVLDAGRSRGARSPCIRRPGKVAIQADAGGQGPHASRDAARDAPEPRYHKPKTPIGRRGASLICLRTDRCGDQTSPAPLTSPSTRGGNAGGRFVTSAPCGRYRHRIERNRNKHENSHAAALRPRLP